MSETPTESLPSVDRDPKRRRGLAALALAATVVAGLAAGGSTTALWKGEVPWSESNVLAGNLDISQGKTERVDTVLNVIGVEGQGWDRVVQHENLEAQITPESQMAWITDITVTNTGDNMIADLDLDATAVMPRPSEDLGYAPGTVAFALMDRPEGMSNAEFIKSNDYSGEMFQFTGNYDSIGHEFAGTIEDIEIDKGTHEYVLMHMYSPGQIAWETGNDHDAEVTLTFNQVRSR